MNLLGVDCITLDEAVNFLNELLELDKNAIYKLVNVRVPCNENLANHPTVQVYEDNGKYIVGLLGILNGLFSTDEKKIAVIEDETGNILKFKRIEL